MLPITDILSCTDPLDEFDSLSYHQTHHAKTYVTGLAAGRSKNVTGIAREVLHAQSERAFSKFITECDWAKWNLTHPIITSAEDGRVTRFTDGGCRATPNAEGLEILTADANYYWSDLREECHAELTQPLIKHKEHNGLE